MARFVFLVVCTSAYLRSEDISAQLNASLAMYQRTTERHGVESLLDKILFDPLATVMILNGRLIVDRRMLNTIKGLHHVEFVKSVMEHRNLKNAIYNFEGNADGIRSEDQLVREGCRKPPRMPLNRVKATSLQRSAHRQPLPKFVIAKRYGNKQCGLLIPNPYFDDISKWDRTISILDHASKMIPFDQRKNQVFWRGAIRNMESCFDEDGNYARLQALSLTKNDSNTFNVRCIECHPRDETITPCPQFPYDADMLSTIQHLNDLTGTTVPKATFAEYKFLLNLPGSVSGSYSRNLNHLWILGSVVLQWESHYTEFYYPALKDGITHKTINKASASTTVLKLLKDTAKTQRLLRNARRVHDRFLCPDCLAAYYNEVIDRYRNYFSLNLVLDDMRALKALLRSSTAFQGAQLVALSFNPGERWSRISFITDMSLLWKVQKEYPRQDLDEEKKSKMKANKDTPSSSSSSSSSSRRRGRHRRYSSRKSKQGKAR